MGFLDNFDGTTWPLAEKSFTFTRSWQFPEMP
jgi:hypothetical protein